MLELFNKWFGKSSNNKIQEVETKVENLIKGYVLELIRYNGFGDKSQGFYFEVQRLYLLELSYEKERSIKRGIPFEDANIIFNKVVLKVNKTLSKYI